MDSISILKQWLNIDHQATAKKLGFYNKVDVPTCKLINSTVRVLDYETTMVTPPNVNLIIALLALLWTHIDHTSFDVKAFVLKMLSRIGYPTSAIIADPEFNKSNYQFSAISSAIDQYTLTLMHSRNEIQVGDCTYLLTKFQKSMWDALGKQRFIGISAPTSAGKSFVIQLKTVERMLHEQVDVIYIVPTLSLLYQVTEDYNALLRKIGIHNFVISNNFDLRYAEAEHIVYVWTQEKAIAALSSEDWAKVSRKTILIVDEIQNIERASEEDDVRAKILYDALTEMRYASNISQIIIAGPRIDEIGKLGEEIFGSDTFEVNTNNSPVLGLTYSIKKLNNKYFFKQYCNLFETAAVLPIENPENINGYGSSTITDGYVKYLSYIVDCLGDEQNIIFSPTAAAARKIAMGMCSTKSNAETPLVKELIKYYSDTVHKDYSLCSTLKHNTAYHHGKLPVHVRRTLESAIRQKLIQNVTCTTTLMQGVNLPAQNIIIRNPHLYTARRGITTELTHYEMANLRGRAGRLLQDFIGRTFVLDESEFEEVAGYDQASIFDDVSKEVAVGYAENFDQYKDSIWEAVRSNSTVNTNMQHYGYLVTYIRQTILRYGANAHQRMNNVGVKLTKEQVAAIIHKLKNLSVPKEICLNNRYWDPFVLDDIYCGFKGKIPNHPLDKGAKYNLSNTLKYLRDNPATAAMYKRYIPNQYHNGRLRKMLCDICIDWAQELPLISLLQDKYFQGEHGPDRIEDRITLLQNTVSFNVPLLIKPLVEMFNPESCLVSCLQSGSYNVCTLQMISIGVPRELAISLNHRLFSEYDSSSKTEMEIDKDIRSVLIGIWGDLPYWERVQLNFLT